MSPPRENEADIHGDDLAKFIFVELNRGPIRQLPP
jgi:hypothetical protein